MEPKNSRPSLDRFTVLTSGTPAERPGLQVVTTRERAEIERWASAHAAQPATGEATASGPAVKTMNDTGAGIRFNFPGFAPFRAISWDEWFRNFEEHDLVFIYEEQRDDGGYHTAAADRTAPVRYRLIKRAGQT